MNGSQLIQEVSMHYIGQSLKQLYVLVLGLDVIGNPFGLVLGLTRGVEDLFYEPFQEPLQAYVTIQSSEGQKNFYDQLHFSPLKMHLSFSLTQSGSGSGGGIHSAFLNVLLQSIGGAVQGPGEFAEGLVLGVRSLFGHTVGGAAGAASRIAGTLGKGIAALSFDPEFQRRRREQMGRQPTNIQEGLARGGRGLVTPISGAMEEGFGGFLKGMGKGVVGLVARPTAGVVDFAGGSLDAVRRAAELSEHVARLRLPRFLVLGEAVRAYAVQEAEGDRLLRELERGRYASTDTYAYHVRLQSGVLLLTDKRVIFLHHNDVFGQWQAAWEQTWVEMVESPRSTDGGIFLMTPRKKVLGLFGGGEHGRTLNIPDGQMKTMILQTMQELYRNAK
ncbi:hypothetical protein J437_LFUL009197 [Ladona fulva]|uniref:Intermembrane lipid transfer protein VPS13-like C-terminal domain-containing protein n=1 Tax=Ladona fulva TaxID=123851 RepID=A0A8K0K901_LADFU|nr:hypothetical protein J437_LFUL009197 [Ladona fulva]